MILKQHPTFFQLKSFLSKFYGIMYKCIHQLTFQPSNIFSVTYFDLIIHIDFTAITLATSLQQLKSMNYHFYCIPQQIPKKSGHKFLCICQDSAHFSLCLQLTSYCQTVFLRNSSEFKLFQDQEEGSVRKPECLYLTLAQWLRFLQEQLIKSTTTDILIHI